MPTNLTLRSFAYFDGSGEKKTLDLTSGPTRTSNESCGVWVFGHQAWKIFSTTNQYTRVQADYQRATENGVPTPAFNLILGTAICNRGLPRNGFALVSTYITSGYSFSLKCGTAPIEQFINSTTNIHVLSRIEEVLPRAANIGLRDPQGFIDPTNASNPIWFIDIHASTATSTDFAKLCNLASARRTRLQWWSQRQ